MLQFTCTEDIRSTAKSILLQSSDLGNLQPQLQDVASKELGEPVSLDVLECLVRLQRQRQTDKDQSSERGNCIFWTWIGYVLNQWGKSLASRAIEGKSFVPRVS
jgi:hypothetical protein